MVHKQEHIYVSRSNVRIYMIDIEALTIEKEFALYWIEKKVVDSSISAVMTREYAQSTQYEYNSGRVPGRVIEGYELEGI
jgi:hypothetical protein